MRIRNPGWKKFGSGFRDGKIRIRDKHPGSATLVVANLFRGIGSPDGYFFKAYKIKSELSYKRK
jgi:hypothetical protein